jgi:ferredoxin--NADP+ reductase
MDNPPKYLVAIIGAGVAGSEAAAQLASQGIACLLFDQNKLPYGKIEEGLPKWHVKLRNQEEQKIDLKIDQPNVQFIPNTSLGRDITLKELQDWGVSAIVLAFGAWRDRRLPVESIDDYIGKGFYYQNHLVSWFNHKHELSSQITPCEIRDGAIVIGGGLASLDVVKIVMFEIVLAALADRGIQSDIFILEKEGISAVLKQKGLTVKKLEIKGCTLYYRRRIEDMPLTPKPVSDDKKYIEKVYNLRKRILTNFKRKYCFQVNECYSPIDKLVENDRLVGLVFQKTGGKGEQQPVLPGKFIKVYSPLVISSIGSVPEKLPEIPLHHDLVMLEEPKMGRVKGFDNVFAVGNAVTGRGNIRESLIHSRKISRMLMADFLIWQSENFKELVRLQELNSLQTINRLGQHLKSRRGLSREKIKEIMSKAGQLQRQAGYQGNYKEWIRQNLPIRLENML